MQSKGIYLTQEYGSLNTKYTKIFPHGFLNEPEENIRIW